MNLFRPAMILAFLGAVPVAPAQERVALKMTNGTVIDAEVVKVGESSITVRTALSTVAVEFAYQQIVSATWPEFEEWTRARQMLDFGRYEEAAALFETIAGATSDRRLGYPAPGNYATLARRMLVECLRRRGDAAGVAKWLDGIETAKLPAGERDLPPALFAWAAAGRAEWGDVLAIVEKARDGGVADVSEQGIELAYLSGVALRNSGRPGEALLAFGRAYSLGAGAGERLPRAAMEEALRTLEGVEDRAQERSALAHLYASLHGKGGLWEEAPADALAALGEPLAIGEAALGQSGRVGKQGDIARQTSGLKGAEQVTADDMKKIEPRGDGAAGKKTP